MILFEGDQGSKLFACQQRLRLRCRKEFENWAQKGSASQSAQLHELPTSLRRNASPNLELADVGFILLRSND